MMSSSYHNHHLHCCVLLTFFIFHSSTSFVLSQKGLYFPTSVFVGQENGGNAVRLSSKGLKPERYIGFEIAAEPFESPPFPLAAERTRRKDPLDGFKVYTNGWNITDHHYWASATYTAVPIFVIAAIWFLGFGLCLLLFVSSYLCRKREPYGYSSTCYVLSLILLILFTIIAMIGCAVLYIGQGSFHRSTTKTLQYVVDQANSAQDKLRSVSDNLVQAKQVGIDRVFLPANVQTDIDAAQTKINAAAGTLAEQTKENSDNIQDLLDSVRMALIIIAAVMIVLTFLGFLFSIFGQQLLVYILIIAGWILVTFTFILCGLSLALHTVTTDTCVAINQWNMLPSATESTAMDEIMPCLDKATGKETLLRSKEVTSELVNLVNQIITNVSNINFAPNFTPLYYNQSGPLMPLLCDPFRPDLTDRQCDPREVSVSNATEVYSNFVCQVSPSEICITQGRLTPTFSNQVTSAITVANALNNNAPSLVQLQDCTFVLETLTEISTNHCPDLSRYSKWIYIGLVMISFSVMFSLIFWFVYVRERRHRLYAKESKGYTPPRTPARGWIPGRAQPPPPPPPRPARRSLPAPAPRRSLPAPPQRPALPAPSVHALELAQVPAWGQG
ncbi:uncharacterized protein [Arachis hypogaea]|uniref:Transmembrane protein n=1 Tax=Arachis hypogaea TaxID=3818 RepID=A0A445C147_ARAHY|nr:uncharacterized protein LOC112707932 isoform X1 [Arachis hypogaea]QHO32446.1 uncharacterized protein DS421_8g249900 [Arachis hypogaea]RYR44639.1 hypothetical protein Ahy_A08g040940 [Arachis hypogaea]